MTPEIELIERALEAEPRMVRRQTLLKRLWKLSHGDARAHSVNELGTQVAAASHGSYSLADKEAQDAEVTLQAGRVRDARDNAVTPAGGSVSR